ncbi:hypothetical protein AB0H42_32195 [Nocardia sp. NPDC050799]|uniref:hypothetical protein n=1 Tax=Nocardia sp. NPDC050799 TaxID=3154842 RepID=UPI00340F784A
MTGPLVDVIAAGRRALDLFRPEAVPVTASDPVPRPVGPGGIGRAVIPATAAPAGAVGRRASPSKKGS